MPIAARAMGTLYQSSRPRFTAPTVTDWATTGPTPARVRRIALMPMAALASSPVERDAKNFVGSLSKRSQTAGWRVASIRPSIRRIVRFCSNRNAADTTLASMIARQTRTIRSSCAFGTYSPRILPVATGTREPSTTVTRPLSSRPVMSPPVPWRLQRIRRSGVGTRSGNGR